MIGSNRGGRVMKAGVTRIDCLCIITRNASSKAERGGRHTWFGYKCAVRRECKYDRSLTYLHSLSLPHMHYVS